METIRTNYLKSIVLVTAMLVLSRVPALAYPPDPNNAALLYYQAFLSYEKPNNAMLELIRQVGNGTIEPNQVVIKYIESCRPAIELAVSAGELPDCDWGLKYSEGVSLYMTYLPQIRPLLYIIIADARIVAKDGDYRLAVERCLTARKMGLHTTQNPSLVGYFVGIATDAFANGCIVRDIISNRSVDEQTLQYLEEQFYKLDSRSKPVEFFWKADWELFIEQYLTPGKIRELVPWVEQDSARERILKADEQFCQGNLIYFNEFRRTVLSALKLPYLQAFAEFKKLEDKVANDFKENTDATVTFVMTRNFPSVYNIEVRHNTLYNRLKAALRIYLINAQTGKLPDVLPAGLPKDMYGGTDFVYEKTANGFILHSKGEDYTENPIDKYEFKVKK